MAVKPDQVLAFRLARSGLAERTGNDLAKAAACPASDFDRDAALLALSARMDTISRESYDAAADAGRLVLAHVIRGAIHALAPFDHGVYGRSLVSDGDAELSGQLGQQVKRLAKEHGIRPTDALEEVADATRDALRGGRRLTKNELHDEYRTRVRAELMPWCRSCGSHHVAPMLWRYATVKTGARLDSQRCYRMGKAARARKGSGALRRFLAFYGPATPGEFAEWAGLARSHATRLWGEVEPDLTEVPVGKRRAWLLDDDAAALESPPQAEGVRLLPPGDPYPEAEPAAARAVQGAGQAPVPPGRESRCGAQGRAAGGPVADQAQGWEGRGLDRETRPPGPQGRRGGGRARRGAPWSRPWADFPVMSREIGPTP